MDLRHLVSADHANIRQIADQIMRSAGSGGPTGRDSLFDQFDNEVRRHMKLMATVVEPALGAAAAPSRDHKAEHRDLERRLDALDRGDKNGEEWTSRFDELRDELDRVFGEHTRMIATLDTRADADDLVRQYERAKMKDIRSSGYVSRWSGRRGRAAGIGLGLAAVAAVAALAWQRRARRDGDELERSTRDRLLPVATGRTTSETTTVRTGGARPGGQNADAPVYTAH